MAAMRDVIKAWSKGEKKGTRNDSVTTTGTLLYSYALVIGFTTEKTNRKVLLKWTPPRHCGSTMTAGHITVAAKADAADERQEAPEGHARGCWSHCNHIEQMEEEYRVRYETAS